MHERGLRREQVPDEPWSPLVDHQLRLAEQLEQLGASAWMVSRVDHELAHQSLHVRVAGVLCKLAFDRRDALLQQQSRVREVVTGRDEVQRCAHESRLHDLPGFHRLHEVLPPEPVEPRPEREVRRGRPLGLQRSEALDCTRDAHPYPSKEQLPGKQRPIQLCHRENAWRAHASSVVRAWSTPSPRARSGLAQS
jgi:hypothetical protein